MDGPHFSDYHKLFEAQYEALDVNIDDIAERIATLGGEPNGLPGTLVASRHWTDYSLGRATVPEHLGALDIVYNGVITSHRQAVRELDPLDPITQDILIEQTQDLEMYQWFVRAHLQSAEGALATDGARTEAEAAAQARKRIA